MNQEFLTKLLMNSQEAKGFERSPHESEVAVLIPCHNEEITIGKVIDDFRHELPAAVIYVFDNCSTDFTAEVAGRMEL